MIQILIFLSVLFFLPFPGSAEEMTAEKCVSWALRENQVLKAQEMEVLSWEEKPKYRAAISIPPSNCREGISFWIGSLNSP